MGVALYNTEMCEWLAARGHSVHVICTPPYYPQWKVQPPYRAHEYSAQVLGGVEVTRCPVWMPRNPRGISRILYALSFALSSFPVMLRQIFKRPDVVFVTSPSLLNALPSLITARLTGAVAWLHVQDFELDIALGLDQARPGKLQDVLIAIERMVLLAFDVVSTISARMLVRLQEKQVAERRRVYFPNWVDTRKIYPVQGSANAIREELKIAQDQILCLFAGSLGAKQGVEFLVEAARLLEPAHRNITFLIGGEGPTLRDVKQAAAGLSNVIFLPLQPPERLNTLLNAADIHVLTQRPGVTDLVMPSKLLGMLASGRPVIATVYRSSEVSQCLDTCGIVVEPGDAAALASAITSLAEDRPRRVQMGAAARTVAVERFSADAVLHNFEATLLNSAKRT